MQITKLLKPELKLKLKLKLLQISNSQFKFFKSEKKSVHLNFLIELKLKN